MKIRNTINMYMYHHHHLTFVFQAVMGWTISHDLRRITTLSSNVCFDMVSLCLSNSFGNTDTSKITK